MVHEGLRYCLHESHFVFWLEQANQPKIVIAILHVQMDLVRHLTERISDV
jgi:plasmid stabilization system protein ParE